MRSLFLPVALGLGAVGVLYLTPQTSEASGRRCYAGYAGAGGEQPRRSLSHFSQRFSPKCRRRDGEAG